MSPRWKFGDVLVEEGTAVETLFMYLGPWTRDPIEYPPASILWPLWAGHDSDMPWVVIDASLRLVDD